MLLSWLTEEIPAADGNLLPGIPKSAHKI